jgi:hypothetical protein
LAKNILIKNGEEFPPENCEHTQLLLREESSKSTGDVIKPKLIAYPNPAADYLQISIPSVQQAKLQFHLFDSMGSQVYQESIENIQEKRVAVGAFGQGIYFCTITQAGELLQSGKLLISR